MKAFLVKIFFLVFFLGQITHLHAQDKNITVKKLYSDELCSNFEISIRDSVRLHYHAEHTENIFVLKGSAKMRIGSDIKEISKGDHFVIPKGTPHAVWVTSKENLKVLSIQSPEFLGKDRFYIDE